MYLEIYKAYLYMLTKEIMKIVKYLELKNMGAAGKMYQLKSFYYKKS